MRKEHWQDWVQVVLGLWVAVSPWILGASDGTAISNFLIVGLVLIALAASEITAFQRWKEWLIAALGTWLLLSPRLLEFTAEEALTWDAAISGLLIVALGAWAIGDAHELLPRLVRRKDDLRDELPSLSLPDESEHMVGSGPRPSTGPDIVQPGGGTQTPGQVTHE